MQHRDTYIASVGLALGDTMTIADAQAAGLLSERQASVTDQRAIRVANPDACLAGRAAHRALLAANVSPGELGPVYHAANVPIEADRSNPASTVMYQLDVEASSHPAAAIHNGDQGVLDALTAASLYLAGCSPDGPHYALVTAGGSWPTLRPRSIGPLPPADGAGALVLTTTPQKARLLATATRTHPALAARRRQRYPVHAPLEALFHDVLIEVLEHARVQRSDITHLITPFGADRVEHAVALSGTSIDQREIDHVVDAGRDIGYLGAADLIAAMKHAGRTGVRPEDTTYVLLLASGIGSVGAAVVELRWPRDVPATR